MKKIGTLIFTFGLVLLFSTYLLGQNAGDYQTQASGDWSNSSIWQVYSGSAWVPVGTPPDGSQTITILSAHSVGVSSLGFW